MECNLKIKIEASKLSKNEYIIKDKNDITVGRFCIIGLADSSKKCDIKLSFYKICKYELLKEALIMILRAVFKDLNIFKVNIRAVEGIEVNSFFDLGFTLEGVFSNNEYHNGEFLDELSFGITRTEYNHKIKPSFIELKGENIVLRNLTPGNAKNLLDYYIRNKEYLAPFEPNRDSNFYTLDGQRDLLNESYRQFLNGNAIEVGIFKKGNFIGKIKVSSIVYGSFKNGIIGYSIDKLEQGHGYMKEAVNLFIDYLFTEGDLHRVEASALLENEKSKGVLKGCRFNELGINKKYLFINGQWKDHVTYYITKDEFYRK
ncbi:GNAT family N-acetyltransferase [Clostridium botulinum]|uniref:GNAT family N-acetyltransferase n=1 Tax=unclassified Clostridium TaxID=2614128 RepID=UPI0005047F65|nr:MULTISPECIES: GNAT family protein [unclassified Clostridium]KFX54413.1 GNAT family acetyltransferase [Clostridium botulinum]MBY6780534.1 GNAT family N-acetyltransferase [Clostridium botulinum]MBY6853760.1 GNAT family N-acetyltransferase [Clostridium botulinum]MBY7009269.1 GNAT family N-acetyltransferase [Clostridium botulinum]NFF24871.1 GNAT family N-acetyltransferase [Clostridium botulinum]